MKMDSTPFPLLPSFFELNEFSKVPVNQIPEEVLNAIIEYHIIVLSFVRMELGYPVIISQKSGFRTVENEIEKKRTGTSMHTFGTFPNAPQHAKKGATDTTVPQGRSFTGLAIALGRSRYTRHIIYPSKRFIHNDYNSINKAFYIAQEDGKLKHVTFEAYVDASKERDLA